jgi:uncharacterized protein YoxC
MADADFEKFQIILQELVRRTNDSNTRIRTIEQRVQSLETRTNSIEENTLEKMKRINEKFLNIEAAVHNINNDILYIKNSIEKLSRQSAHYAMKKDVKEIERMFDLLNPIREEFVTKEQMEKEIQEIESR